MKNIIIMGLPCAGKGTACKKIAEQLGFEHISTGDLIRKEQEIGSAIGKLADKKINVGSYMPDSIVTKMVKEKIIGSANSVGFLYDGFPRTKEQAKQLNALLLQRQSRIDHVIFVDVDEATAVERMKARAVSQNRPDDNESVFKSRIHEYNTQTMPIIKFFEDKGLLVKINGSQEKEAVVNDIIKIIS
jgi:adenylate kinase